MREPAACALRASLSAPSMASVPLLLKYVDGEVAGRELGQPSRQLAPAAPRPPRRTPSRADSAPPAPHGRDHVGMAVADVGDADPGEQVEILAAVGVPDRRALARARRRCPAAPARSGRRGAETRDAARRPHRRLAAQSASARPTALPPGRAAGAASPRARTTRWTPDCRQAVRERRPAVRRRRQAGALEHAPIPAPAALASAARLGSA